MGRNLGFYIRGLGLEDEALEPIFKAPAKKRIVYLNPKEPTFFKDSLHKTTIIRNPKQVGPGRFF